MYNVDHFTKNRQDIDGDGDEDGNGVENVDGDGDGNGDGDIQIFYTRANSGNSASYINKDMVKNVDVKNHYFLC